MLERPQTGILQKKEIPAILNAMGQGRDSLAMDGITPSFALNFAEGGSIRNQAATATFTRATTATVVDQDSIVRTALSGEARMQGLRRVQNCISFLTEGNLVAVGWGVSNSGTGSIAVYTSNFATAPDGTQTAHRVQATLNGGGNNAANSSLLGAAIATTMSTVLNSCWVRTNDGTTKTITLRVSAYNPATDTVVVGPTWQRLSTRVGSSSAAGSNTFCIGLRGDAGSTCSDSCDVLFWHPQCEDVIGQAVQTPGEYVSVGVLSAPYHGANVDGVKYFPTLNGNTVSNNIVTEAAGAYIPASTRLGYLSEGARTNVCLQSEDFTTTWGIQSTAVTANATVGPDGLSTADKITELAAIAEHYENQAALNIAASQPITCTVYAKAAERNFLYLAAVDRDGTSVRGANFNLSTGAIVSTETTVTSAITSLANGWYRCSISYTLTAGATAPQMRVQITADGATKSYLGVVNSGIYAWGAQAEQATFASSYIPTTTVAVTRNIDVLTYPTTNWYNSASGTFFAVAGPIPANPNNSRVIADSVTSATPLSAIGAPIAGGFGAFDSTNSVNSIAGGSGTLFTGQHKGASVYGPSILKAVSDGGTVFTTAAFDGTMITNSLLIGGLVSNEWFGPIAQISYFPRQVTSNQLQNITR